MKIKSFISVLLTLCLLLGISIGVSASYEQITDQSVSFPLRVNAGSTADYTSDNGETFLADQDWSAGSWGFLGGKFADVVGFDVYATGGTDIKPVFATQRQGWTEFRASGIENRDYLVTLYFREEKAHGPGLNRVTLKAEGATLVDELDIYENVGRDYALTYRFATSVTDGELNIEAQVVEGVTSIAALEIKPAQSSQVAPSVPQTLIGQNSYDAAQIDWQPVSSGDLHGYNIYRSVDNGPFEKINPQPIYIDRYQDKTAVEGIAYRYQVSAIDAFGLESGRSNTATAQRIPLSEATLPIFNLTIEPIDWEFMYAFPFSENSALAQLEYEGETYDVSVRYRGAGSRGTNKKNWKIKFDGNSPIIGRDTLNLNADNMDFSYVRGPLSYSLLNSIGVDAAQHQFALLFVNGTYMGVYNDYEQIDKNYMARTGRNDDTVIYKAKTSLFQDLASEADYEVAYEKNNKRTTGHAEIIDLIESLSGANDDLFPWLIQNKFDIQTYLDIYAFTVWSGQFDAFDGNNYLLYDAKQDTWEMIPWDFDFAFGTTPSDFGFNPGTSIDLGMESDRILPQRGVNVPQYRQYFCHQLQTLSSSTLSEANVTAEVEALLGQIMADARRDWLKIGWENNGQLDTLIADFETYINERNTLLNSQIPAYCSSYDQPYLKINEVVANNLGAVCDGPSGCNDDWLEIYNLGLLPVDLNGMYLSDNNGNRTKHKINGSIVVPPLGHVVLWADGDTGQGASHLNFELPNTSGSLYLSDATGNLLDSFQWADLADGSAAVRLPDGTETIKNVAAGTHGFANTNNAPTIEDVHHSPSPVSASDSISIQATVLDEGDVSVTLHYQLDGNGFATVPMTALSNNVWQASIGPRPSGSRVQYYISATDEDQLIGFDPSPAPQNVHEYVVDYQSPVLYINEIMASNSGVYFDPDEAGESPDYVEIYNPGPWAVNLADMYATDTLTNTTDFRLGKATDQLIIGAGEHLLLLADDDGKQGDNHLGFKLSKGGEAFGLFERKSFGNQEIDSHTFEEQTTDVAIGRCEDGGAWQILDSHSPGRTNNDCGRTPPVLSDFSQSPRYPIASTSNPVQIKITADDDGSVSNVVLHYRFANGSWLSANMTANGNNYSALIPGVLQRGLIVEYYIEATDNEGAVSQYPLAAPANLNRFMYHTSQPETFPEFAVPPALTITELVANSTVSGISIPGTIGGKSPWIEIYNGQNEPVDLSGYKLAHDLFFPHDYTIPAGVTVPAKDYILFLLDDNPENGPLHAAFKPVRSGDTIGIYSPHNILIDSVSYGAELEDGAVLRLIDAAWGISNCATPGTTNTADCVRQVFLPLLAR